MLGLMRFGLSLSIGCMGAFLLGGLAISKEARACSPDPCTWTNQFTTFELVSTRVAPDGVVPFTWLRGDSPSLSLAEALDHVTVEVRDGTGELVAGSLVWKDFANAVVWQPNAELIPGDAYTLQVVVDNAALVDPDEGDWLRCAADIEDEIVITVGERLPAAVPVAASTTTEHDFLPIVNIDHMVCCDEAMPENEITCAEDVVWWSEGHCESTAQQGRITLRWDLDWEGGSEVAANYAPRLTIDQATLFGLPGAASLSARHARVVCGTFELVDLRDGTVVASDEDCFGEDVEDLLGLVSKDPSPGLEVCMGVPYVCEVVTEDGWQGSKWWDPDQCQPWDRSGGDDDGGDGDGDDGGDAGDDHGDDGGDDAGQDGGVADRGCGCTTTPSMPAASVLWLLALTFTRRRR
jgi:MYXO-CTERM domain-containing protein